jgi:hypothetical protein
VFRKPRVTSIGSSSSHYHSAAFSPGSSASWINDTIAAIKNSANLGGILGALANSGGTAGTVSSFLGQSSSAANNLALISQHNVTNASSFYAQIASQHLQQRNVEKLQQALNSLNDTQNQVQAKNVNPFVYLPDGSTIDTVGNIMTTSDGTRYDITTGAKYTDPAHIIQMANGAYLNTSTNILTMSDGTQIDTVTGLKVSTTA